MLAASGGDWLPSYAIYVIPNTLYLRYISYRNAINGISTIVVPPDSAYAGNINNTDLPIPVGITATIRLTLA
jgi:hypothetical protein